MTTDEAIRLAKDFLLSGMPVAKADEDSSILFVAVEEIQAIIDAQKDVIRRAVKEYRTSADTDAFLTALLPIRYKAWYEAYSPYWLSHCHPVTDHDDEAEFTFYNDLIDMYWAAKWQEWKRKGEWCVTVMMPPTKGLTLYQYAEDMRKLDT